MFWQFVLRHATCRWTGPVGDEIHQCLCGLPGLQSDPGQHPDRKIPVTDRHHRLHQCRWRQPAREVASQHQAAAGGLQGSDGTQGSDAGRSIEGSRLCDVLCWQMALGPRGVLAREPGIRCQPGWYHPWWPLRRQEVLFPLRKSSLEGRAARRTSAGQAGQRDGQVHRDESREAVPGLPVVLLGSHPADRPEGSSAEVPGQKEETRRRGRGGRILEAGAPQASADATGSRGLRRDDRGDGSSGGHGAVGTETPRAREEHGGVLHVRQRGAVDIRRAPNQ